MYFEHIETQFAFNLFPPNIKSFWEKLHEHICKLSNKFNLEENQIIQEVILSIENVASSNLHALLSLSSQQNI